MLVSPRDAENFCLGAASSSLIFSRSRSVTSRRSREFSSWSSAIRSWLLFKHYKIDPSDEQSWQELALSLAIAHVPGLQFANRPKPGRKTTWKTGLGDELVRAVEDVQSPTGVGIKIKDALLKLHVDKLGRWKDYTVENLDVRYREARARQKVLASLREAWLNEIATAIVRAFRHAAAARAAARG